MPTRDSYRYIYVVEMVDCVKIGITKDVSRRMVGLRKYDTTSPIGKFVLIMLSAAAQFERELIRERTMAGIARAKECGVRFGRASVMSQSVRDTVESAIRKGCSVGQAAVLAGVAESTVRKYYKASEVAKLRSGKKPKRKAR